MPIRYTDYQKRRDIVVLPAAACRALFRENNTLGTPGSLAMEHLCGSRRALLKMARLDAMTAHDLSRTAP